MSAQLDQVLYDHVGQIVATAVLQGIIVGSRENGSAVIRTQSDEITKKATEEILAHLRERIQRVREEEARSQDNNPF